MGRVYSFSLLSGAITTGKTLALIRAAAAQRIRIHEVHVVSSNVDTGEQLELEWAEATTIGAPTGTTPNVKPYFTGDVAHGTTTPLFDLTAEPTTYSTTSKFGGAGASSIGGYHRNYLNPAARPELAASEDWGFRLLQTIASQTLFIEVILEIDG